MRQWTIEKPEQLTFDTVSKLNVRIVAGRLAVLASDGPPTLEVADIGTPPLIVTHEDDGTLTVTYKDLTWDGLLGWLRPGRRETTLTLTVPKDCPVNAGVVSASAVVAGFESRTSVKSVSGEIVLDGVSGEIHADTVSGDVESRGLVGDLSFKSVSGELTVAQGTPRRLRATTVSGRITADLELPPTGHVTMNSVSGEIMLRLPRGVETDVTIRSTSGRLDTAFAELRRSNQPGARTLTGRIGGGMASLSATTVSADVTLLKGEQA
ncbi:DUF4097 family beta strand repeat-containing protein [Streptosporangium roseum]|uniref:DUF4097 domain-containing protein n=1 Tax=Streptosporangium roseum (strain ATCC 12428 / DSM 43021 / JCM 3005 / KCTC 9067 / NCIMB 10171 / NRRL 2505 / NI 9100) TaxID=479432 RepID=D2AYZ7_STRRD|nr:DUF4097 family beta strand repeat-containing protein [Streptosporangium roseum]ACZ90934.1 hypothetical protein Sros_8286 [Streptosporangium roseum DSM 43021]